MDNQTDPHLTKRENITKINQLIANFANTKDETKLKQIVQEIIEVSSSFKYEAKWRDEVMKIIIPGLSNILLENIPAIADGSIEPLTDHDVDQALTELKNITESTTDT